MRTALALFLTGALVVAGCGLPNDDKYTAIQPDDVPFGIADTTTTSTTSTTLPPATTTTIPEATTTTIPTQAVSLFFVLNGRLQPVVRSLPMPVTPQTVVNKLEDGPLEQDQPPGLRSAVPANSIGVVSVTGGVATVDISPAFVQPTTGTDQAPVPNVDQPLAFGEIVLTLTSLPGIGQVRFTVASQPQGALAADGSLVDGPVSADNYASLRAA
jgi:spore germination protein GerM